MRRGEGTPGGDGAPGEDVASGSGEAGAPEGAVLAEGAAERSDPLTPEEARSLSAARTMGVWASEQGILGFVRETVLAAGRFPRNALGWSARVVSNQVRFTFLHGIFLVALLAFPLGAAVSLEALRFKGFFGVNETLGVVVVLILVRHFGPLLTAMLVVGRSGTAIATEMATIRLTGEMEGLRSMGVDPLHYYVHPRLVGGAVAMPALIVVFDFVAVAGAWVAATLQEGMTFAVFRGAVLSALGPMDVPLTLLKGALFGVGMALFCVHAGLVYGTTATAIPVAASRGVIRSLLFVFVCAVAFAIIPRL